VTQERPVDPFTSWPAISRHWRIVVAFLTAGLLIALVYTALSPRLLVARSLVLLPPVPADPSGATRDMGTESRIAMSSPVLANAIKTAGVDTSVDDLRPHVAASELTSSLLEIRVKATSARQATRLANAVARGYVQFSKQSASQKADTAARSLRARAADLSGQVNDLQAQLADQEAQLRASVPG
jgi:uncharacterized protein involved in exopolysaccharide biosynthesis